MNTPTEKGKIILVVGGGTFGEKAVRQALTEQSNVYLIDPDPNCPARALLPETHFLQAQARAAYKKVTALSPDLIVPAAPRHIVAEWLTEQFAYQPSPEGIEYCTQNLPKDHIDSASPTAGILTLSLAEEGQTCPEDCPGPPDLCPLTGKVKPHPLHEIIRSLFQKSNFDLHSVLVPKQYAQTLGAFQGEEIFSLFDNIAQINPTTIALATTSACHGVIYCGTKKS